ncbi:hypothetical protein L9F63_023971, partial [Diploptera punctata]
KELHDQLIVCIEQDSICIKRYILKYFTTCDVEFVQTIKKNQLCNSGLEKVRLFVQFEPQNFRDASAKALAK